MHVPAYSTTKRQLLRLDQEIDFFVEVPKMLGSKSVNTTYMSSLSFLIDGSPSLLIISSFYAAPLNPTSSLACRGLSFGSLCIVSICRDVYHGIAKVGGIK